MLNTWQGNLIFSLISGVVFLQCYKLAVAKAKNDGAATVLLQLIAGLTAIALIPFFEYKLPTSPLSYGLVLGACIFYAITDRLSTTVRKNLQVSVAAILGQLSNVFIILYGILLYQEPLIINKVVGTILIIAANILLQYKEGKFEINKYVIMSVIASLALATGITIDIKASQDFNLAFYTSITFLVPMMLVLFIERIPLKKVFAEMNSSNKIYFLITGIAWELTIVFLLRAYQVGTVSTIAPLAATAVFLNVIVAYIFLKERSDLIKKLIAAGLVIAGIYLTIV